MDPSGAASVRQDWRVVLRARDDLPAGSFLAATDETCGETNGGKQVSFFHGIHVCWFKRRRERNRAPLDLPEQQKNARAGAWAH